MGRFDTHTIVCQTASIMANTAFCVASYVTRYKDDVAHNVCPLAESEASVSIVHFPWTFDNQANESYTPHMLIWYLVRKYFRSVNGRCNESQNNNRQTKEIYKIINNTN